MKILVVSGFLGAGKTTFIKTMSQITGRDFCVFENEYSEADIDKAVLSRDTDLEVWELTENCICCSGKQDFAATVLTIANTIDPEYLIVEPTGVAKLSSVIENLSKIQYERIALLKPVTIVDGMSFWNFKKENPEIYLDQIENADTIVVSKTEGAVVESLADIAAEVRKINPAARVLQKHYSLMEADWWAGLLARRLDGAGGEARADGAGAVVGEGSAETADPSLETMTLRGVSLPSPVHLISFLEMLSFGVFGRVSRAKGFFPCPREWLAFDFVDRVYSITGIEAQSEARAVFIGKDILRSGLRGVLRNDFSKLKITGAKKRLGSAR